MHILFAGGGTAGHINPALAVAGTLRAHHPDVVISYIGTAEKLESRLVPEKGYDFFTIDVAGFQRKISLKNIERNMVAVRKAVTAAIDAKHILQRLQPDIVMGTGGYVSGPVLREAARLGFKTAIHEQNAYPGVTTKMLAPQVDMVLLAMPEAAKYLRCKKAPIITGNPVREELLRQSRAEARALLKLDDRPMILSFGGSLGARPINEAVAGLIRAHCGSGKYYHIHATGSSGYEAMQKSLADVALTSEIDLRPYIDNMDVCMAAADLVICRAGAITLSELQACGKPAVLIPSPYVAENHQYHNAMTLQKGGSAVVLEEKDLTADRLTETVFGLLKNSATLDTMAQAAKAHAIADANERIYQALMQLYTNA